MRRTARTGNPGAPLTYEPTSMTATAAELFPDLDSEFAATRRTLERVPFDRSDWKPHEKSYTLGRLATHLAELPSFAEAIATRNELDLAATPYATPAVGSNDELLALFDRTSTSFRRVLMSLDAERLAGHWRLRMGDQVLIDAPRSLLLRQNGISHPAHHRAQLGVYLRLLGIPVPGVYGPSADEM
jgi:uncharacterized damage-inducible protein DinB